MIADSPSRRAMGTLRTAAASSTTPNVRKPNSPCSMLDSVMKPAPAADVPRLRPHPSLTWIAWRGGARRGPGMVRDCLGLGVGLVVALAAFGAPAQAQVGYDRPGGDYASFPMRSADPAQCAARCER